MADLKYSSIILWLFFFSTFYDSGKTVKRWMSNQLIIFCSTFQCSFNFIMSLILCKETRKKNKIFSHVYPTSYCCITSKPRVEWNDKHLCLLTGVLVCCIVQQESGVSGQLGVDCEQSSLRLPLSGKWRKVGLPSNNLSLSKRLIWACSGGSNRILTKTQQPCLLKPRVRSGTVALLLHVIGQSR